MSLHWIGNLAAYVVAVGVILVFFLSLRGACERNAAAGTQDSGPDAGRRAWRD
ncbi:MAG: hypothetical protein AB7D57_10120 [Desulfovibrionaceae bacterium]